MSAIVVHSSHRVTIYLRRQKGGFMSIFGKIKDAIFGNKAAARPNAPSTPAAAGRAPSAGTAPSASQPRPTQSAPQPVDVEAVLQKMAADNKQQLNWRTSIVDLMKLLGMDSSMENRKELARELGYTGDTSDSAAMNIWLHKRVMKELAAHGGKVPANMLD
jgi:3-oxoacyl-ACP reductase-like protein